jgi:BirA family biotin operon repressor/biotin-[acetyl-CoA-carboxylase] ligase
MSYEYGAVRDELQVTSDSLNVELIRSLLAESCVPFEFHYLAEVDSTNRVLSQMDETEIRHGLAIITDFQSAGRGRLDRSWIAPRDSSVLMSVALEWPGNRPLNSMAPLGALAVFDAIRQATKLEPRLKWPNDVLIRGRKVSGILSNHVRRGRSSYAVIGIGVNVNLGESELAHLGPAVTSLSRETGAVVAREVLVSALFVALDMWYRDLQQDPDYLCTSWISRLDTIGRMICVEDTSGVWHGMATGVRRDGGLVVRKDDGKQRTLYAGDVSVRPFEGFTSTN